MSHHYEPSKSHEKPAGDRADHKSRPFHRTWWFWVAVVLMLGAMLWYGLV